MTNPDQHSHFYNAAPTPLAGQETARSAPKGLDFGVEQRVNPEDLTGGNPTMSALSPETVSAEPHVNSLDGLEHLIEAPPASPTQVGHVALMQAVVYLRVSTPRQLHTAADLDEDGNSIATQRVETLRKVRELGVTVAKEFVEPGQSAQTISKRAEFRKLLRYVEEHPQVKFVVIYMRSRVFRNFTDAAITKRELLERGVRLISAKEEFGEGYMADAMEAITDIMNEVQVRMNGEDVKVKMAHKVEQGGTVGRAKLGYVNVRKDFNGRLVNTIDVDYDRAPLVAWAFEQYATGRYSISQMTQMLEERGLTTRPSPSRAAQAVSRSRLALILRNPYYTGIMRYKGALYVGRHEPLVSKETFLKVQEVLDHRNRKGDRDIVHFHYLKGLLRCGVCQEAGRSSRLVYSQNAGNGGTYEYLVCTARQHKQCSMPWLRVEQIEAAVLPVVAQERMSPEAIEGIRESVSAAIANILAEDRDVKTQLTRQLRKLEAQEERLIDLAATGTLPIAKIRERIEKTTLEKEAIKEQLEITIERLNYGSDTALAYIELLREPGQLYKAASDTVRRDLLTAYFTSLTVQVEDNKIRLTGERHQINAQIREISVGQQLATNTFNPDKTKAPRSRAGSSVRSIEDSVVHGSSNVRLAGVPGLEPRTKESESSVLPITPYPTGRDRSRAD
jgi:site-specific DNA recombinase